MAWRFTKVHEIILRITSLTGRFPHRRERRKAGLDAPRGRELYQGRDRSGHHARGVVQHDDPRHRSILGPDARRAVFVDKHVLGRQLQHILRRAEEALGLFGVQPELLSRLRIAVLEPVWTSISELGYPELPSRRGHGDNVASMAQGARI